MTRGIAKIRKQALKKVSPGLIITIIAWSFFPKFYFLTHSHENGSRPHKHNQTTLKATHGKFWGFLEAIFEIPHHDHEHHSNDHPAAHGDIKDPNDQKLPSEPDPQGESGEKKFVKPVPAAVPSYSKNRHTDQHTHYVKDLNVDPEKVSHKNPHIAAFNNEPAIGEPDILIIACQYVRQARAPPLPIRI